MRTLLVWNLFFAFLFVTNDADAAKRKAAVASPVTTTITTTTTSLPASKKKVVYQENQTLDFEGLSLEGELKAPGEFYFQNRNQERFDGLTKRRANFRREMLRDAVQSN